MTILKGNTLACGGEKVKRRTLDYYPTPPEVTHALMRFLKLQTTTIWEPACGEGHMSKVLESYGHEVHSSDIAETGYGEGGLDFLAPSDRSYGAIITNPPFVLSEEFIRTALGRADTVCMLLKSQYWHAAKRYELFTDTVPRYVLPLTWRPDFLFDTRDGSKRAAPTMECCWTVWDGSNLPTEYVPLKKQGVTND